MRSLFSAVRTFNKYLILSCVSLRTTSCMLPKRALVTSQLKYNLFQENKLITSFSHLQNLSKFDITAFIGEDDLENLSNGKLYLDVEEETM